MRLSAVQVSESLAGCGYVGKGAGDDAFAEKEKAASFSRMEVYVGQSVEHDVLYAVDGNVPDGADASCFLMAGVQGPCEGAFGSVENASAAQAVNLVNKYLTRAGECADRMRACYYGERDLQGLCQALSDFVGNPVLAYDDTLLPVAQTEFPREFAVELFGSETLSVDYVFRTMPYWSRDANADSFAQVGAVLTTNPNDGATAATCNVYADGHFQGFLEIFQACKPISAADMHMLEIASKIASVPFPFRDSRFLIGKLEGRETRADLADSWLSSLRWSRNDSVYVIAINMPPSYGETRQILEHTLRMMRSLLHGAVNAQIAGMPVYVANDRLLPRQKALRTLATFLETIGEAAHAGVSEIMVGIGRLHEGYAHAQFAARFADVLPQAQTVVCFENCRFAFFSDLCNMGENKSLVVDETVAQMYADDVMTRSENVLTVKTFIETGFNLAATAQTLSVHRNTVAYRLKHVAERYGLDLSSPIGDANLVFTVLLSSKLLLEDA